MAPLLQGYRLCAATEGKSLNSIAIVTCSVNYFLEFLISHGPSTDAANAWESDEYRCLEKRRFKFLGEYFDKQKNKTVRVYTGEECVGCKVQSKCTHKKDGIRYIKDFPYEAQRNIMREKMKTSRKPSFSERSKWETNTQEIKAIVQQYPT